MTTKENEQRWLRYAAEKLKGRKIDEVRYLTASEANDMGWFSRPLVMFLDNGTILFPSRDDEGHDGGALFGQEISPNNHTTDLTFPVLGVD